MQKTLGGDRLGAGKKMTVDLHNYDRSTHDLGYVWRSTMSSGTLVPFICELGLPGDTFDIDLNADIKTHPSKGPLFGSYKVQLDVFTTPWRLYNSQTHNNELGIGRKMINVKIPQIELNAQPLTLAQIQLVKDIDNMQINPSCILAYLGIRGIGLNLQATEMPRNFNCLPLLMYWEIYKNYYANKQEEIGAVIHTPYTPSVQTITTVEIIKAGQAPVTLQKEGSGNSTIVTAPNMAFRINYTGTMPDAKQVIITSDERGKMSFYDLVGGILDTSTPNQINGNYVWPAWGQITLRNWNYSTAQTTATGKPGIATFPLSNIDDMRKAILAMQVPGAYFTISKTTGTPGFRYPYSWLCEGGSTPNTLSGQEGLALKTYQSDVMNNWLKTDWIDGTGGINDITKVSTATGSFEINALLMAKKVFDVLNRIAVSGGSYDDWIEAVYGQEVMKRAESPVYMGGLIKELVFQEVVSQGSPTDASEPLGTLGGKGVMAGKHKGGKVTIKLDEPSYIIGIISLTPRIDYSQGNKWDTNLKSWDDIHKPGMDGIGFQELNTGTMAWWDETIDNTGTVIKKSAGKQPAWINYMTNVNRTYGNFAIPENEMFMTLNRRYEMDRSLLKIKDLTTYIDPSKYNFIFAETAIDAQNFWAQISVDMIVRRKISARQMPNL